MIWQRATTLAALNAANSGTLAAHLGIQFVHLGDAVLEATMPVDERTRQPFGMLHGGASVALAETLASVAGSLCVGQGYRVVGVEINASHMRAVPSGVVRGVCRPLHAGRRLQTWQIDLFDESGRMYCTSRLTTAVIAVADDGANGASVGDATVK